MILKPHQVEYHSNEITALPKLIKATENQEVIQHAPRQEGESVGVEQVQAEEILQIEPAVNSSTTGSTQIETSSHILNFRIG